MEVKTLMLEQIEREREYLSKQEVGTDEYVASLNRLTTQEEKLMELEKFESNMAEEKKDRFIKNGIEIIKFGIGGVVIPVVGLICITATEKDTTFTGALKEYTRLFIPKKWL